MELTFTTKLSIKKCIERIKENAVQEGFLTQLKGIWNRNQKFIYRVEGEKIRIQRVYGRNILRPIFNGKFSVSNSSTKIKGTLQSDSASIMYSIIFDIFWFGLVITFGSIMIGPAINYIFVSRVALAVVLHTATFPLIFILFGIGINVAMWIQTNRWKKETIEFIEKTLQAKREE